jgi:hypothetical protein
MIYEIEIQKCISVRVFAESKDEARSKVINNLHLYKDEMIDDCYISNPKEITLSEARGRN